MKMSKEGPNTSSLLNKMTPRTLLSSLLDHQETTYTVRQPSRQITRAIKQSQSKPTQENVNKKRRKSSIQTSSNALSSEAPIRLITDTLDQTDTYQTLQAPVQNASRVSGNEKNEPAVSISRNKKEIADIFHFAKRRRSSNQDSSKALNSKTPRTLITDALDETDTSLTLRAPVRSVARVTGKEKNEPDVSESSNDKEIADIFHFEKKKRQKRIRLSEIDVGQSKQIIPDVFLMDLQARIKSIMKEEKSRNKEEKEKSHIEHETDVSSHSVAATAEAPKTSDEEISRIEDVEMSSPVPERESVQPLSTESQRKQLSTSSSVNVAGGRLGELKTPKQADQTEPVLENTITKQHQSPTSNVASNSSKSNAEHFEDHMDQDIDELHQASSKSQFYSPVTKEITETSGIVKRHEITQETPIAVSKDNHVNDSNTQSRQSMEKSFEATAVQFNLNKTGSTEKILGRELQKSQQNISKVTDKAKVVNTLFSRRKGEPKRSVKKKKTYNLPVPHSQLQGIIKHYKTMNLSKEAFSMIEEVSEEYFQNTARYLEEICEKKRRKKIKMEDVKQLMEMRKHIRDENDFRILVEEYLPMEHREELIPVAISGNKTLP